MIITEDQIEKMEDNICMWASLRFIIWTKNNGWQWLDERNVWWDGFSGVSHDVLWKHWLDIDKVL